VHVRDGGVRGLRFVKTAFGAERERSFPARSLPENFTLTTTKNMTLRIYLFSEGYFTV